MSATITVPNITVPAAANNRKIIIIKNYAPFSNWICKTKNTQIDNAKDIDIDKDEPFLYANSAIADFPADNNNSASFKFKTKIAGRTRKDGPKNVKIRVTLKYLSNVWRTLEMPLNNSEINLV